MADRFFYPNPPVDGIATLEGDEARHLARVRRVAVGECVELFDGKGRAFRAEVEGLGRDRVTLRIVGPGPDSGVPACSLTLATAVPKGDRFDWLVEKATEVGVARLVPLTTARSVVDPRATKLDRLRRAIIEAAKQSRRDRLMDLDAAVAWSALVRDGRAPFRYIADPSGPPIAAVEPPARGSSAILAIGPEGGFAPEELAEAADQGWRPVGLGAHILRIETAALVGAATLLALSEAAG
ncbi:RsmE family RNA methyltransferase [Tundrisphaera sp. TA3]|uniref:RsmE family RNA methyltransferase n=1 Tax=Tundrisphaera sp. TA3 TaxID=3435775 RepID=UPI003EC094F5